MRDRWLTRLRGVKDGRAVAKQGLRRVVFHSVCSRKETKVEEQRE